jgi:MOSC domain-containing protein YiiM
MSGQLAQLNISNGGMPKRAVLFAHVSKDGIEGDKQRNLKYHGGRDRAVCLYSEELYAWLRDEHGIDLSSGSVGENFTTRGIDLSVLKPGDRLRVGECLIELTKIRVPCRNLNKWHTDLMRIIQGRSGWVAKVIEEAVVQPGDTIEVLPVSRAASPCAQEE